MSAGNNIMKNYIRNSQRLWTQFVKGESILWSLTEKFHKRLYTSLHDGIQMMGKDQEEDHQKLSLINTEMILKTERNNYG